MTDPGTGGIGARARAALAACGAAVPEAPSVPLGVYSPLVGDELFELEGARAADATAAAVQARSAFASWRLRDPGARAAAVAAIGREIESRGTELGDLIAIETGKPRTAAAAEVEGAVRACAAAAAAAALVGPIPTAADAAGQVASRRPLGATALLGSVGEPLLDWAATASVALACGCAVVWKPAGPLIATAVEALVGTALRSTAVDVPGLHAVIRGEADAADTLAESGAIASVVRPRPPGANVAIVAPGAEPDAVAARLTAAALAGDGRSPASLRFVLAHASVAAVLERRLAERFAAVVIGDPFDPRTALGPLADLDAYRDHLDAVQTAEARGERSLPAAARATSTTSPARTSSSRR